MKLTESKIRKIIRETVYVINYDSGEVLQTEQFPTKYLKGATLVDDYMGMPDAQYKSLHNDLYPAKQDASCIQVSESQLRKIIRKIIKEA